MTVFGEYDRLLQRLSRAFDLEGLEGAGGPVCYGYTLTVGPDGRPVVREYGNARPSTLPGTQGRQPPVDTIVDEKNGGVKLVAEMPGVEKGDIKIVAQDEHVEIKAERGDKKYAARVPLDGPVDRDSARASYKNGILEISFDADPGAPAGKTVEVA